MSNTRELEHCDCRGCELRRRRPVKLTKRDLAFLAGDQPNSPNMPLPNRVLARLRRMSGGGRVKP